MAQGKFKVAKTAASKSSASSAKKPLGAKKGGPKLPTKNATLARQQKLQKKLTAGTINETERLMAAKAGATGKLTIMKSTADKAIKDLAAKSDKKKGTKASTQAKKIVAASTGAGKSSSSKK